MEKEDLRLWEIAKARVTFRIHAIVYVIVNILFWISWYSSSYYSDEGSIPWPFYPLIGWGIGLFFHYSIAYRNFGLTTVTKEFDRLRRSKKSSH